MICSTPFVAEPMLNEGLLWKSSPSSSLLKLGTLVMPVIGWSKLPCFGSMALMILIVFVDPAPGFQPVREAYKNCVSMKLIENKGDYYK